jgi:hypothetical protein
MMADIVGGTRNGKAGVNTKRTAARVCVHLNESETIVYLVFQNVRPTAVAGRPSLVCVYLYECIYVYESAA